MRKPETRYFSDTCRRVYSKTGIRLVRLQLMNMDRFAAISITINYENNKELMPGSITIQINTVFYIRCKKLKQEKNISLFKISDISIVENKTKQKSMVKTFTLIIIIWFNWSKAIVYLLSCSVLSWGNITKYVFSKTLILLWSLGKSSGKSTSTEKFDWDWKFLPVILIFFVEFEKKWTS